ncbi:MAG: hypothetical protein RBS46_14225 [Methyloversatilis sp.]|jgi:hypothetical protein|nr:hypothetical protein [Methyloversatilis sp.]
MKALITGLLCAAAIGAQAAEPLSPIANPSLYESLGTVGHVDSASGTLMIGGKRYRANANTVIFINDGRGNVRKVLKLADIPPNVPVSFSAGQDGQVTQIYVGSGIQPFRP